jgi:hypothetical protein
MAESAGGTDMGCTAWEAGQDDMGRLTCPAACSAPSPSAGCTGTALATGGTCTAPMTRSGR